MTQQKQQGAALLTAILITAVVAILASNILLNQKQWIAQTALADRQNNFQLVSHRLLDWGYTAATMRSQTKLANDLPKWPSFSKNMQNINVKTALKDGNRLYNLNWLVDPSMDESFARLILVVKPDMPPIQAYKLAASVTGAIQLSQSIKPSDTTKAKGPGNKAGVPVVGPFLSVTELKFIPGFNHSLIQQLKPLIAVLPVDAGINMTTGNKIVMRALLKPSTDAENEWMAYLSCRQSFQGRHPNKQAWQSCLQDDDGTKFLTNFGASSRVQSSNKQNSQTSQDNEASASANSNTHTHLMIYRSNYAVMNATMQEADLTSQLHAVFWLPNKPKVMRTSQNTNVVTQQVKVTLVSYWRS